MPEPATLPILLTTTATIALFHTAIGVDHTLPFVVLARARGWSLRRVLALTALCGLGHVLSSILLGIGGIGLGVALERLAWIETGRGALAAWLLIGFGLAYAAWSVIRTLRHRPHAHAHVHGDGTTHAHRHTHEQEHLHPHADRAAGPTVWVLFIIFVFGPCEPLIPLLLAPAAQHDWMGVAWVGATFSAVTIATMLAIVAAAHVGLGLARVRRLERHAHTLAGLAIAMSGIAIEVLGI